MSKYKYISKFSIKKKSIPYILIFLGILIPNSIRRLALPGRLGEMNLLFLVASAVLLINFFGKRLKKIEIFSFIYVTIMLGICFVSNNKYGYSLEYTLFSLLFTSVPYYLLCYRKRINIENKILFSAFTIFNVIVNIIVFVGVINRIGGNWFNTLIFNLLSMEYDGDTYYRLWSFYGHPLYNSFLIIVYYSINYLACHNFKTKRKPSMAYVSIVSLIGIILGESKAAIFVFLLLLITLNFKSVKSFIFELVVVLTSYFAGFFDFIIRRISQTSLSSMRFENYAILSRQSYFKKYMFFFGYGTNFERNYYKDKFYAATAAYEIPILSFLLDYGILYSIFFIAITIIYPLVVFVKHKHYDFLICWVAISAFINTFNAIVIIDDYLFIYIFLEALFIYLSDILANQSSVKLKAIERILGKR